MPSNDANSAAPNEGGGQPDKIMTPEEYAALKIIGWHGVLKDCDGFGAIGVKYGPFPSAAPAPSGSSDGGK